MSGNGDLFSLRGKQQTHACCRGCGGRNARKVVKTDSCLRESFALLCDPCRRSGGWSPVAWDRTGTAGSGVLW